jgi:hypothetical protein
VSRSCKVITTCFAGRSVRMETTMCGDPPGPYMHAQNFPDAASVLDLLGVVLELERTVDPGRACDTIIVNQDTGWERGNRFLASLDGSKTFGGKLRMVTKPNYGNSLGGYHHAFERFHDEYDYWTFAEDDILITGDRWLERCIATFERRPDTGFVAIIGLSKEFALHAHAAMGTTHVRILDEVRRVWGTLPHRGPDEAQRDVDHTVFGEVLFTHLMHRLGHPLVVVDAPAQLYAFAYDYIRARQGLPLTAPPPPPPRLLPRALRKVSRLAERWAARLG